jgi:hypothetical protein
MVEREPVTIITCRRGQRRAHCEVDGCIREHTKLCDFPLKGRKAGQTCDRKMCDSHAAGVGPDRDYCIPHASLTPLDHEPSVA